MEYSRHNRLTPAEMRDLSVIAKRTEVILEDITPIGGAASPTPWRDVALETAAEYRTAEAVMERLGIWPPKDASPSRTGRDMVNGG